MAKNTKRPSTAGLRRARHFAEGGSQHAWRGGLAHTIPDKRKKDNKSACRKFTIDE